ncbi:hypothetical protein D3C71_1933170 [compost metagenome]
MQYGDLKALADPIFGQQALQCSQRSGAFVQLALEELHAGLPKLQVDIAGGQLLEQVHQLTPLTTRQQRLRTLLDERGLLCLARAHGVMLCFLR